MLYRLTKPVLLDIEVEAADPFSARRVIDEAFEKADALNTPDIRLKLGPTTGVRRARVLDARPQGPTTFNSQFGP